MKIWEFIFQKLKKEQGLILMVVIDNQGSSPGRVGFKMAVAEDGEMIGSIGGGVMEYNLVELAKKQILKSDGVFVKSQKHSAKNDPDSSGMICSGSQLIAFYPLEKKQISIIEKIVNVRKGVLIFDENGFRFIDEETSNQKYNLEIYEKGKWLLTEQLGLKDYLYILGSGHVSVSVSELFKILDFEVVVFDNRDEDLPTFKSNTYADSKQVINFEDVAQYIPEGDNIYVVIMTFSHNWDHKILQSLIDKKVKYLGMMASKKKRATIYGLLENEGVSKEQLSLVDSPIGIEIKSQTPAEIAISIAAKIISVKNL
jgi:xanthine dehydrogenase accessory factor